ncbi:DUF4085 family protein [Psychrobacillus sp. FSL H8-0483]|uniref:DUF4085 family protein n=1 Tax=Psychrobacillus sp. FSL H8-0483 TaxID=2921389 RepID=UPI00315AF2D7
MKYFTKEWYELCQRTSFHLPLEEEKKAETFSEDYFQQLYNNELNSWITLQEEIALILKTNETANIDENTNYEPFNRDKAIEQFHLSFINNQEYLKKELSEPILNQIADIRVYALYKASRNVINAVTQFCEKNEKDVTMTSKDYRRYINGASASLGEEIIKNFSFHDCTIIKSVKNERSLKLLLDNTGGFTNIDEVIFENVTIIQQDGLLQGSWWLYEEIYKSNDKYEFRVLLQNITMGLIEFIISADQILFKSNKDSNYNS